VAVVLTHTIPSQSPPWYYVVGNWINVAFGHPLSVCAPLWTVSIEEQSYLVWPLLMKILQRHGMIIAAVVPLLLATLSPIGVLLPACARAISITQLLAQWLAGAGYLTDAVRGPFAWAHSKGCVGCFWQRNSRGGSQPRRGLAIIPGRLICALCRDAW
jgi:peptidoglycan/LPS O-acetylase OafA/YrhL